MSTPISILRWRTLTEEEPEHAQFCLIAFEGVDKVGFARFWLPIFGAGPQWITQAAPFEAHGPQGLKPIIAWCPLPKPASLEGTSLEDVKYALDRAENLVVNHGGPWLDGEPPPLPDQLTRLKDALEDMS